MLTKWQLGRILIRKNNMETLDRKIDKLIEVLKIKKRRDVNGNSYYSTTEGKLYQRHDLKQLIREILGIDKQCSQCLDWFFNYDLSVIEGSDQLICQKCAEDIIAGVKKLEV